MCNTCVAMMEGVPPKILGQATLRHSTFIHYPLSIIIIIINYYFYYYYYYFHRWIIFSTIS